MKRINLEEYIGRILENCVEDLQVGYTNSRGDNSETNYFTFVEDGYNISGSFNAEGKWGKCGDGFFEPKEEYLKDVKVSNVEIHESKWWDEDTDQEFDIPQSEIDVLIEAIEKKLPEMAEYVY